MAKVVLGLREAYEGDLPPVCIRCGAPASVMKNWTFSNGPGGLPIIVLPYVAVVAGKIQVRLPFCGAHKHHLLRQVIGILGGSLLVGVFAMGAFAAFVERAETGRPDPPATRVLFGMLCLSALVAPLAWLGACLALHRTSVRLLRYDRRTITLGGVSERFVEALEESDRWR